MTPKYTLDLIKVEILHLIIKVLFWFSLPLTIYSWSRFFKIGFLPVMLLHSILLLILLVVYLKRKTIAHVIQAHTIVIIFLLIAFGGIPTRGQLIYGIPGGIFATTFATILFNRVVATRYLVFQVLIVLSLGLIFGVPDKRFQSIFELVSYSIFQFFLIISLDKIRLHLAGSIDELNQAVMAKTRFLATMSHEIRTPLNGITLAAENLQEEKNENERKEMASIIVDSSRLLKDVIDDILDYSKMDEGKIKITRQLIKLDKFLKPIENDFSNQARDLGLEFNVSVDESLEYIHSDPFRLEQILRNLLTNAFKFTSSGFVDISFSVALEQNEVLMSVTDTGIGIAQERQEEIFEEFEQERSDISRHYGGTGLGLAIVKILCEKLEGKITLKSDLEQGSQFKVSIPFNKNIIKEKLDENKSVHQLNKEKIEVTADTSKCVLVVEDNEINITVFLKRLSNLGFKNVFVAKNGEIALDVLKKEVIDLVFIDVQMPVMGGLEATKAIRSGRAGEKSINLPIVGLSANSFDEDKEIGIRAGMSDYLGKPLKLKSLVIILNKYL